VHSFILLISLTHGLVVWQPYTFENAIFTRAKVLL